jgi:Ca2+-binding EF-hand superfamily protein
MSCYSHNLNFSKYTTFTQFKENQIKSFYQYFKKYSANGESLTYREFKHSLGILGAKSNEFVCNRLFELIDVNNIEKVKILCKIDFL